MSAAAAPRGAAATPESVEYARRWKTLGVLSLSLFIIGLDNTILNVALPTLQDEFSASPSELQWMVDSYLLVFAGLLLVVRHARRPLRPQARAPGGRRRSSGSPASARSSPTRADQVIAVRAVMGVGAALIMPATLSIIANVFTRRGARQGDRHLGRAGRRRDRARAAGRRAAARVVRLVVGVPRQRAVRGRRAAARHPLRAREPRPRPGSFDVLGARSRPPASAPSCTRSSRRPSGLDVRPDRSRLFATIVLCSRLPVVGAAHAEPMLDLGFFRSARFSVGTAAVSVAFFALLGAIFALTQYLQFAHGYSAIEAGAVMSPIALGLMIGAGSSSKAGRPARHLTRRRGRAGRSRDPACATTLFEPDTGALAARRLVLRPRARRWAGSWPPRPTRSSARCPRRSPASPRPRTPSRGWSPAALGVAIVGSLVSSLYSNDVEAHSRPPAGASAGRGARRRRERHRRQLPAVASADLLATTGDAFTAGDGHRHSHPRGAWPPLPPRSPASCRVTRRRNRVPSPPPPPSPHRSSSIPPERSAHVVRVPIEKRRRPHGPLERTPPQAGDLRLARVRPRRVRRRNVRRRGEAGDRGVRPRRVRVRGHDPRGGVQAAGGRDRADPAVVRRRDAAKFQAAIRDVVAALLLQDAVTNIRSPLDAENASQISRDGRSAIVDFQIRGDSDLAVDQIDPVLAAVAARRPLIGSSSSGSSATPAPTRSWRRRS